MAATGLDLFQRGGPVMWAILLCSVAALTIVIERLLAFTRMEAEMRQQMNGVRAALQSGQRNRALSLSETPTPLTGLLRAALLHEGRPRRELRLTLDESVALDAAQFERYLPLLGTVAHLAPLLGLLGTVTGLVRCFQVIQERAVTVAPVNPADLAGGIWESLLTTVFGLLVAIPAFALYTYLVVRSDRLTHQMEAAAGELTDLLCGDPPNRR